MNRRGFLKAGALVAGATAVGTGFQTNAEPPGFPWVTREFDFEGTPVVEFLWPKDREILLRRDPKSVAHVVGGYGPALPDQVQEGQIVMVPTFDCRRYGNSVEQQLRMSINATKADLRRRGFDHEVAAHLVRVQSYPYQVGILVDERGTKCLPVEDFFAGRQKAHDVRLAGRSPTAG